MTAYRKKPVVIEAVHYTGTNLEEVSRHMGTNLPADTDDLIGNPIFIETLEGTMQAGVGDFIIRGVNGEFYPCKPEIFAKTYEPVDTRAPDPDLEAHIGAVLAEAAEEVRTILLKDAKAAEPYDPIFAEERREYAEELPIAILAINPTALAALDRAKREARVEGLREAQQAASLYNVNRGAGSATARAIVARIQALIEAEKRIAEILPGPTLIDAYGLPGDEADDWDIRVGKLAAEKEGKP